MAVETRVPGGKSMKKSKEMKTLFSQIKVLF
jgi:hypothetical protein